MNKRIIIQKNGEYFMTNHVATDEGIKPVSTESRVSEASMTEGRKLTLAQKTMLVPFAEIMKETDYFIKKNAAYNAATNIQSTMNLVGQVNSGAPVAVDLAKQTGSNNVLPVRREYAGNENGDMTVSVTIQNTTAGTVVVPIFDGLGLNAIKENVPAVPVGVVISGTWDAATLTALKNYTSVIPVEINETTYIASAQNFYSSGNVRFVGTDIGRNPSGRNANFDFNKGLSADQFNPLIQKDKRHYLITPEQSVLVKVAAGATVTITYDFVAKATAYNMVQI